MGASEAMRKAIPVRIPSSSNSIICEEKVLKSADGKEEQYKDFEYLVVLPQSDTPREILLNLMRSTQNRDDQLLELVNSEEIDGKIYARLAAKPQSFSELQKNILRNIPVSELQGYIKYRLGEAGAPNRESIDRDLFSTLHKLANAELAVYQTVPGAEISCDHLSASAL